MNQDFTHASK